MGRSTFVDQVRTAVDRCGMSRYALCKKIGLDQAVMSRFMAGKGFLSEASLNALAGELRLKVSAPRASKSKEK